MKLQFEFSHVILKTRPSTSRRDAIKTSTTNGPRPGSKAGHISCNLPKFLFDFLFFTRVFFYSFLFLGCDCKCLFFLPLSLSSCLHRSRVRRPKGNIRAPRMSISSHLMSPHFARSRFHPPGKASSTDKRLQLLLQTPPPFFLFSLFLSTTTKVTLFFLIG